MCGGDVKENPPDYVGNLPLKLSLKYSQSDLSLSLSSHIANDRLNTRLNDVESRDMRDVGIDNDVKNRAKWRENKPPSDK